DLKDLVDGVGTVEYRDIALLFRLLGGEPRLEIHELIGDVLCGYARGLDLTLEALQLLQRVAESARRHANGETRAAGVGGAALRQVQDIPAEAACDRLCAVARGPRVLRAHVDLRGEDQVAVAADDDRRDALVGSVSGVCADTRKGVRRGRRRSAGLRAAAALRGRSTGGAGTGGGQEEWGRDKKGELTHRLSPAFGGLVCVDVTRAS